MTKKQATQKNTQPRKARKLFGLDEKDLALICGGAGIIGDGPHKP